MVGLFKSLAFARILIAMWANSDTRDRFSSIRTRRKVFVSGGFVDLAGFAFCLRRHGQLKLNTERVNGKHDRRCIAFQPESFTDLLYLVIRIVRHPHLVSLRHILLPPYSVRQMYVRCQ